MKQRRQSIFHPVVLTVLVMTVVGSTTAQVATTPPAPTTPQSAPPPPQQRKARAVRRGTTPVIVDDRVAAPQVVTILRRLNGLSMFRLLLRSGEEIGAITRLDEAFRINDEVHTSVIAGLAMDDGETIAARLPQVDAELGPAMAPAAALAPQAPLSSMSLPSAKGAPAAMSEPGLLVGAGGLFDHPDVTVIGRDGKRLVARYIGLDGVTGLSVLRLAGHHALGAASIKDLTVNVGQRIRVLGPEPVERSDLRTASTIYVRIGETEARVVSVTRAPSGTMARIRITSAKLSPANIGGIAINDAGETVGIVEAVEKNEATLLPHALVRSAARRVLEKQASVPRPWLGIRGEPIGAFPIEQMLRGGWQAEMARSLVRQHRGILLTSVAPGSPAAGAALRPGDVILRVNEGDIKNADDFSWLLEEVGAGNSVNFTVARPGKTITEAIELTLSEAPVAFYGSTDEVTRGPEVDIERVVRPRSFSAAYNSLSMMLLSQGIETIALRPPAAARFGAASGLLVIYVNPQTRAFKSGLRSGDIIEKIDGRSVISDAIKPALDSGTNYSLNVVRNKEKLVIKVLDAGKNQ